MKTIQFFRAAIIMIGILLSACTPSGTSSAPNVSAGKPVSEVIFTGVIESINGAQWVINGQTITVDPSVLRDGPFVVGDTVNVEASVALDGSVTAQRVETPSVADAVETSTSTPDASQTSTETPASTPDVLSTPGATQPLVFDNNGNEAFGTVDSITSTSITLNGQTFNLAAGAEIKDSIASGAVVKLHFSMNADGSLSVTEVEIADPTQVEDNHNGSDDGPNHDANDDHGGDHNSNDDGPDHDSNDDHGGDNSGSNSGSGG